MRYGDGEDGGREAADGVELVKGDLISVKQV